LKKLIILLLIVVFGYLSINSIIQNNKRKARMSKFEITSLAFKQGKTIPAKYTCDGINISPPLSWSGIPTNTQSLALVVEDPDVPVGMWDHWVVYNIDPSITNVDEGGASLANFAQGLNTGGEIGYHGICPPDREHRYYFRLYALDSVINGLSNPTKSQLITAMQGHILGEAVLMARYNRYKK
jgi:Raf kinase inhibitor-like YbhB/YbcL family protein